MDITLSADLTMQVEQELEHAPAPIWCIIVLCEPKERSYDRALACPQTSHRRYEAWQRLGVSVPTGCWWN